MWSSWKRDGCKCRGAHLVVKAFISASDNHTAFAPGQLSAFIPQSEAALGEHERIFVERLQLH